MKPTRTARVYSPRLVHPEQVADFQMEIAESPQDIETMSTDVQNLDEELSLNAEELFLELDQREDQTTEC